MELKPTDLILRHRLEGLILRSSARGFARRASRRMAAGSVSLVAVLRDARNPSRRALQDEVECCVDMIRTSETKCYY
jgi:hypothetical protein